MKRILKLVDARLAELLELRLGHLLVAPRGRPRPSPCRRRRARRPCRRALRGRSAGGRSSSRWSFLIAALVNLVFFLTMTSAADLDVARGALAGEEVELDALGVLAALLEVDRLGVVEVVEEILRRVAERAEEHRRVHLPAAVDADEHDVLRVELEVEPRAAVRDDARAVEELAARVGLALVVVEEDARAAVQLADDDALGAVDDERAGVRHQRDLAEVDLLLLDVADDALAALAGVVDHQLRRHLDRRRVRHAALAALLDVVLRLLEVVADEDELARAVEVLDREDAAEDRLQADLRPLVLRDVASGGTCRTTSSGCRSGWGRR